MNDLYENFFINEVRLLSMKQKRLLKQRSEKFLQLKDLCLDLLKTSNQSRKITVADRVTKQIFELKASFGLHPSSTVV